jgi:hypothetical protein
MSAETTPAANKKKVCLDDFDLTDPDQEWSIRKGIGMSILMHGDDTTSYCYKCGQESLGRMNTDDWVTAIIHVY